MSYSVFDHPFLSGLFGDAEMAGHFSAEADIRAMLSFESALARAEAACGLIPRPAAEKIAAICETFRPDMAALREATGRDGVVIPELVRQLKQATGDDTARYVHFGATSQDVIDTSLMLRLKSVCALFKERLNELDAAFARLESSFGDNMLMGHTRMQAAIPVTVSDRIRTWREPFARHRERLAVFLEKDIAIQFGGAAGTLEKLGDKAAAVRAALARELGLSDTPQWHSQRERLAELAGIFSLISGSGGKFGQDIALLAQMGNEISLAGGGGSSAMPHKQNPVAAETLVSLARFNATQLSAMHHALVHEQERSGAAWMLEWMSLPQITAATASTLLLSRELAGNIQKLGHSQPPASHNP